MGRRDRNFSDPVFLTKVETEPVNDFGRKMGVEKWFWRGLLER
jgi:hypothetical protein